MVAHLPRIVIRHQKVAVSNAVTPNFFSTSLEHCSNLASESYGRPNAPRVLLAPGPMAPNCSWRQSNCQRGYQRMAVTWQEPLVCPTLSNTSSTLSMLFVPPTLSYPWGDISLDRAQLAWWYNTDQLLNQPLIATSHSTPMSIESSGLPPS